MVKERGEGVLFKERKGGVCSFRRGGREGEGCMLFKVTKSCKGM